MASSDDEKSDQWVESYDSMESDEESDVEVPVPVPKLKQKPKSKKRPVVAVETSEESSSNTDSDQVSGDSADEAPSGDSADEAPSGDHQGGDKLKSNPAWANAMSKVLNTKKSMNKKAIVLSKAKKMANVKEKKPKLDFEIEGTEAEQQDEDAKEEKPDLKKRLLIKEQQAKGRVKPSILDRDRERKLMKIATRGVVQLFNAVRQQQKAVDKTIKKAGKSELKREKVLETIDKKKFLDVLTGSIKSVPASGKVKVEEKSEENSTWSVLRDDFMMGTKLKDWDKREEII